jgi:hypothetical protein
VNKKPFNQNALAIIELLQKGRITGEELSARQRRVVVKYFMEEMTDQSNTSIASLIGVTDVHVCRIKRELMKRGMWEIESVDIKMLALGLLKRKVEYQRRAAETQNWSLAWKIECDFIEKMQSLGFVYKEPERLQVQKQIDTGITEFMDEYGVPSVGKFFAALRELHEVDGEGDNGNGKGDARPLGTSPDEGTATPCNRLLSGPRSKN